jgi:hypothetical protein
MQSVIWWSRQLCFAVIMPKVIYQHNWLIGLNAPGAVFAGDE